ncbi:MAG TPA: AAA family ATPase [Prosthecobacter sp.]
MNQSKDGVYDPLEGDGDNRTARDRPGAVTKPVPEPQKRKFLQFYKPSEIAAYEIPEEVPLIGDLHVFRGGIFVLGGAPGVGKSFALSQLALSGATGADWFGMKVHRRFKTMILQAENGMVRLASEYKVHCEVPNLDEWVRVSGDVDTFAFENPDFCVEFRHEIEAFAPDVIVLDPWNRAARDNMEKDFRVAFENIIACLPDGPARPALMIVAHTRKPKMGERVNGRGLLNLLSGSLILGSVPRAAFILQAASDDPERSEFVFSCCKNNNGKLGGPTAWRREGVQFVGPLHDFDWERFNNGGTSGAGKNSKIEESDLVKIFEDGRKWLSKDRAAKALMRLTGAGRSAAYLALDMVKGRFSSLLRVNPANGEFSVIEAPESWDD